MAVGIQIFDAQGREQLGPDDRIMRILGQITVGYGAGSYFHEGLLTGTPFYFLLPNSGDIMTYGWSTVEFSEGTMAWNIENKNASPGSVTATLIFGVY